jgi:zinc D-Ala-D-Ala carboxypeptidase|tara:strand:+ start:562 stop:1032 length:471 start_codon:yes stop_codon:yes gene_type:complete
MKQWDENTKLSNNFSIREFTKSQTAKRKNIDNSIQDEKIFQSLIKLCQNIAQPIREHYKIPFSPNSGYRCPALNKAIGGSATSQHCLGQAVDIEIPTVDNMNLFNFVKENLDYDQIILEYYDGVNPSSGWVHISYVSSEDNRKIAMTFDGSTYRIV